MHLSLLSPPNTLTFLSQDTNTSHSSTYFIEPKRKLIINTSIDLTPIDTLFNASINLFEAISSTIAHHPHQLNDPLSWSTVTTLTVIRSRLAFSLNTLTTALEGVCEQGLLEHGSRKLSEDLRITSANERIQETLRAKEHLANNSSYNTAKTFSKLLDTASHLDTFNYAGAIPAIGLGVVVNTGLRSKPTWTNKVLKLMEKTSNILINAASFSSHANLMGELTQYLIDSNKNLLDLLSIVDSAGSYMKIPNTRLVSPDILHRIADEIHNPHLAVGLRAKTLTAKALINQASRTSHFTIDPSCRHPGVCSCKSIFISLLITLPTSSSQPLKRGPNRNTLLKEDETTHYYIADLSHPSNVILHSNQHNADVVILSHPTTKIKTGTTALLIRSNQIFIKNTADMMINSSCYSRNGSVRHFEQSLSSGSIILEDYCRLHSESITKPSLIYDHVNHKNSITWDRLVDIDYSLSTAIADKNASFLLPIKKPISDNDFAYMQTLINDAREEETDFREILDNTLHRSFIDEAIDSMKQTAIAFLVITISILATTILIKICLSMDCHPRYSPIPFCLKTSNDKTTAIRDLQSRIASLSSIILGSDESLQMESTS